MQFSLPVFVAALTFFTPFGPVVAQTAIGYSVMISQNGLEATRINLKARTNPSRDTQFALGAVHFLRGIERTLQLRWQYNATLDDFDLPVLRLPVTVNPDPFDPALITRLFTGLLTDMESSRAALAPLSDGTDVALDLDLNDLWFDINMNTRRYARLAGR
jgi:hypothetical protein